MAKVHIHQILPYTVNSIVKTPKGEIIQEQLIRGSRKGYKVVYNGDKTIVILSDGSKGIAKRNPNDPYNIQIGHDIAHARAIIKQQEKEIEDITKNMTIEDRRIDF
ncbi:hypothetical protein ACYCSU_17200 [Paenibacillus sp. ALE1]